MIRTLSRASALALALALTFAPPFSPPALAEVPLGDDGLHKPAFLKESFKILAEDVAEAQAADRHVLLIVEQRGCIYCAELHEKVLTDPRVLDRIGAGFDVIQIDMFGGTEITDLDGEVLTEKRAAGKWGVTLTPALMFLPPDPPEGADAARAALAVVPGIVDADRMVALMDWAAAGGPATGRPLGEMLAK